MRLSQHSTRVLVVAAMASTGFGGAIAGARVQAPASDARLTLSTPAIDRAVAKTLENPVPAGPEAIAKGKRLYDQFCVQCHGEDGKAQFQVVANATDLTAPDLYNSGTTDGEVFRSIRDGAGTSMPPYKGQIKTETEIWQLVHYVRSLRP